MEIIVGADATVVWLDRCVRCALGRGGITAGKREGDGATPAGRFPLREVYYRPDRLRPPPGCGLPVAAIDPGLGWCDDPADAAYNHPVRLPFAASHEDMWREDGLYDLLAVVGCNDDPVIPGRGSAIFLHVARPDFAPTEGCVALALDDLIALLDCCQPGDVLSIVGGEPVC
ncbi:MAG: L,D-transpeptidase family protein [Rhodospirillales bacterium]